jgi:hypothetical protein
MPRNPAASSSSVSVAQPRRSGRLAATPVVPTERLTSLPRRSARIAAKRQIHTVTTPVSAPAAKQQPPAFPQPIDLMLDQSDQMKVALTPSDGKSYTVDAVIDVIRALLSAIENAPYGINRTPYAELLFAFLTKTPVIAFAKDNPKFADVCRAKAVAVLTDGATTAYLYDLCHQLLRAL